MAGYQEDDYFYMEILRKIHFEIYYWTSQIYSAQKSASLILIQRRKMLRATTQ